MTLHSVDVQLPAGGRTYPGGEAALAININCMTCHTAGMVLTQPTLTPTAWREEIDKMRNAYKAQIADADVPAILAYLTALQPAP